MEGLGAAANSQSLRKCFHGLTTEMVPKVHTDQWQHWAWVYWQLRERYGDVFTVYLGPRPVVMICGTEAIREALVDQAEAFSGRGKIAVVEPIFQGYGKALRDAERGAGVEDGDWGGCVWEGRRGGLGGPRVCFQLPLHSKPPLNPQAWPFPTGNIGRPFGASLWPP